MYALIAFSFGALAGFQGIYERYGSYSNRAWRFLPGLLYLLTRGLFPALGFAGLYHYGVIRQALWLQAAACGAGWELFVRSKWYVKSVPRGGDKFEEIYKGPLDLIRWYQSLFLKAIDSHFAKDKIAFVGALLPERIDFLTLCERVNSRINAWTDESVKHEVNGEVAKLIAEFEDERHKTSGQQPLEKLDEKFRYRLCYIVIRLVGRDGMETLVTTQS